jgi:hypothetical protein
MRETQTGPRRLSAAAARARPGRSGWSGSKNGRRRCATDAQLAGIDTLAG